MSRNLRSTVGVIAGLLSVTFLLLWVTAPKLTEETVLVNFFGWGTAATVQAVLYGVPTLSLLGLVFMSFGNVLAKKHAALESTLNLGGRDVVFSDVGLAIDAVEDKRVSVLTHRFTCPRCSGNIAYISEVLPIVCDVDSLHSWPDQRSLSDELVATGNRGDADRLMKLDETPQGSRG